MRQPPLVRTLTSGVRARPVRLLVFGAETILGVLAVVLVLPWVSGAPWRAVAATVAAIPAHVGIVRGM